VCVPFHGDKMPLINLQASVLFKPAEPEISRKTWVRMFKDPAILNDIEQHNAKYLFGLPNHTRSLESRMPIQTIDDFKGKKVGVGGGAYFPKALNAVGAVGVTTSIKEYYTSLKTGVIDASMLCMPDAIAHKLFESCPYGLEISFGCQLTGAVAVNRDTWNQLPSDVQQIMVATAVEAEKWNVENLNKLLAEGYQYLKDEGITWYDFSYEQQAEWANKMEDYPAQWAKEFDAKGLPASEAMKLFLDACKQGGHKFPREWGAGL